MAECIAKNLNIVGCFNIQLRKNEGKYYIFEINPRISGTVFFRHGLSFQDVRWWLAHSSNELLFPYIRKYAKAVGIREFNEKIISSERA
jgi:carbamoyl-phosphate synthase large subunit